MTKQPDNPERDDSDLSSLYQTMSTELPSPDLDRNILWQARQAAEKASQEVAPTVDKVSQSKEKPRHSWLRWQWAGGLAASVFLVSFLWISTNPEQELSHFPEPPPMVASSEPVSPALMTESATPENASEQAYAAEKRITYDRALLDNTVNAEAKTEQALSMDVAEELQPVRLTSRSSPVTDSTLKELKARQAPDDALEVSVQSLDELLAEVKANRVAEFKEDEPREAEFSQARSEAQSIAVIASRISRTSHVDMQLEEAFNEIKRYQKVLYQSEIQNAEDEKRLTDELTTAQLNLFKLIQSRKQLASDWRVLPKYIEVLTLEQQKALEEGVTKPE